MCWLNIWYNKMFNKLGWMALSMTEKRKRFVKGYFHRLKELLASAEKKHRHTTDFDRKNDILIIIEKVKKLRGFARTLYKNKSANDEFKPGEAKVRTIKELHKWHAKKYKKLAWIALLHSEGSKKEVKAYLSNLADLHASVIKKLKNVKDDDKLYDLKIVLRNVEKLRNFADTLLS
jgi:hypothetical protein